MRDARALLASIGTSALLVAAAVASLLSVSVVFAVGGFDGAEAAGSNQALVLDVEERGRPARRSDDAPAALVVRAPAAAARRSRRPASRPARSDAVRTGPPATSAVAPSVQLGKAGAGAKGAVAATPARPPARAAGKPNLGDGVKKLGDDLSSTLKDTGAGLAAATAPLSKPVGAAVQQIANVVAALLQQVTNGLGDLLGAQPGK